MRRKSNDLSIKEQWHLLYESKKAQKRQKFKFDSYTVEISSPSLRNTTLPSLAHFKQIRKHFNQGIQNKHRNSQEKNLKNRYSESNLEVTKLKNEYFRSKLSKENLSNEKKVGLAMREFMDENKRWIAQGKIKMI